MAVTIGHKHQVHISTPVEVVIGVALATAVAVATFFAVQAWTDDAASDAGTATAAEAVMPSTEILDAREVARAALGTQVRPAADPLGSVFGRDLGQAVARSGVVSTADATGVSDGLGAALSAPIAEALEGIAVVSTADLTGISDGLGFALSGPAAEALEGAAVVSTPDLTGISDPLAYLLSGHAGVAGSEPASGVTTATTPSLVIDFPPLVTPSGTPVWIVP